MKMNKLKKMVLIAGLGLGLSASATAGFGPGFDCSRLAYKCSQGVPDACTIYDNICY